MGAWCWLKNCFVLMFEQEFAKAEVAEIEHFSCPASSSSYTRLLRFNWEKSVIHVLTFLTFPDSRDDKTWASDFSEFWPDVLARQWPRFPYGDQKVGEPWANCLLSHLFNHTVELFWRSFSRFNKKAGYISAFWNRQRGRESFRVFLRSFQFAIQLGWLNED